MQRDKDIKSMEKFKGKKARKNEQNNKKRKWESHPI